MNQVDLVQLTPREGNTSCIETFANSTLARQEVGLGLRFQAGSVALHKDITSSLLPHS